MLIYRKMAAVLVAVLMLVAGLVHAEERPPVADRVIAYAGEQGVKVWTLRIGERSANQALVQIEGIDHDWNMRIQKMDVVKTDKVTRYYTTVDGQKFAALVIQGSDSWSASELYLPGEAQALKIGYSDSLSEQGNAQAFLTDYLSAQK
ncbi:hypothetical protein [Pseudomonas sp. LRF_L74]|uniref:hypothetical protein n=1 Tax=Pseudomonas sp. LRF_L74 TaxID=3369422 RepID=UPI003F6445DA